MTIIKGTVCVQFYTRDTYNMKNVWGRRKTVFLKSKKIYTKDTQDRNNLELMQLIKIKTGEELLSSYSVNRTVRIGPLLNPRNRTDKIISNTR